MAWLNRSASRKWMDITHLAIPPVQSGRILFQQDGHRRTVALDQLRFVEAGSGQMLVIPAELGRPTFSQGEMVVGLSSRLQVTQYGNVQGYNWTAGGLLIGQVTYSTEAVA
jgi:hypothetical protein